jgi:hypothetical protein
MAARQLCRKLIAAASRFRQLTYDNLRRTMSRHHERSILAWTKGFGLSLGRRSRYISRLYSAR